MWHTFSVEDTFKKLKTSSLGLTIGEVKKRLTEFGLNKLPEEKPLSGLKIFLRQFYSPLIYILVIAGIITLVLKDFTDTIVIFGAVFLNTIIGFFQENKTAKILSELKKIIKEKAIVLRDGNQKEIDSWYLVPGDIVILRPGDKVPADGRLIEVHNLKINEFSLTGEWISAEKKTEILPKETPLADRDNMVYTGTLVEEGQGKAVITETGLNTEIGKIAILVKETRKEKTPYQKKVAHFSKVLGLVILFLCLAIFFLGIATGKNYFEMLITAVAIAVAAIPEGLPAAVTVTFAFGMREILKRKGLVRNLIAAEILGSTSIIFTDKTGTLTEAKMQVAGIFAGTKELLRDGQKYSEKIDKNGIESHITALKIATLTNTAFIENPEDELHQWIIRGRPTERALLLAGIQAGLNKKELLQEQPKIDELPFDPVYKYSATLHKFSETDNILYVLGTPEIILERSRYLEVDGRAEVLVEGKIRELNKKTEELTSKGERVLAAAYRKYETVGTKYEKLEELFSDLVFVGLIALKDPLRKGVKQAINLCQQAGMKPIIVTGDHKLTAKAIAKELGLPAKEENILEGKDLDKMDDNDLKKRLKDIEIYARVEPRHKMRIIQAWQEQGRVVAMTGDGVNDAPALKKANIGVALGSGTEVAKEASDLVLLTDNFSIIITAVEEGRRIMDNIRKMITYLLVGGFAEIMLIGLSVIFRLPLPVLPGQILWKNLIESTPPVMALTFEPKEKDIMSRQPEDPKVPLLTGQMKILIFVIGFLTNLILFGLFLWLYYYDFPLDLIRSMIFVGLAIDSFFLVFSCRNLRKNIWQYNPFTNIYVNLTVILGFLMLGIALYLPVFQKLLKTVGLGLFEWSILFGFGLLNLILIETTKWYFIKFKARRKNGEKW